MNLNDSIQVEKEFGEKIDWYNNSRGRSNTTGRESVLKLMLENEKKVWWWSWEFVGRHTIDGNYLSHRAPARASDLAIHEPDLVEDRKIGKFKVYRLRRENMEKIKERLTQKNGKHITKV